MHNPITKRKQARYLLEILGDFTVRSGDETVEELHHRHFGSEARVDRAKFQTDDTTTDDDHRLGNLLERQSSGGSDDRLLINIDIGEGGGLGAYICIQKYKFN